MARRTEEKGQRNKSIQGKSARGQSRREFLRSAVGAAGAAAGFWVGGRGVWAAGAPSSGPTTGPSDRLNIGLIGVGGRAASSMVEENGAIVGQNVVAICDVDSKNLARCASDHFPKAEQYRDFRKLLDRKDLDAVMVSTPDHTHAAATMLALESGRHVYCEKPLTHTVEEARRVAETAAKNKRVTQMGTQIHASGNYRRVVELIRSGAIGNVNEVYVFCGKGWWSPGLPKQPDPVPAYLDYDLWLGPVKPRPFHKEYHPASWRRFWAFGNGTLGDMACHYMDLPFWALGLRHPNKVKTDGPPVNDVGCPEWLKVQWDFPADGARAPVKLHWYDGGKLPEAWESWGLNPGWKNGVMFLGDKGRLFADYNNRKVFNSDGSPNQIKEPPKTIPDSIGHHREWIEACKKNDPAATTCNFGYSGALTETVLLGAVAFRTGKALDWDAKALKATNAPEADHYIHGEYAPGWGL